MLKATKYYYECKLPYTYKTAKEKTESELSVYGVNDLIYIYTNCGGKCYEKLKRIKQPKTKPADEVLKKAVDLEVKKIQEWLDTNVDFESRCRYTNGADFYKHGIKTNQEYDGWTLGGYFERVLENWEILGYEFVD